MQLIVQKKPFVFSDKKNFPDYQNVYECSFPSVQIGFDMVKLHCKENNLKMPTKLKKKPKKKKNVKNVIHEKPLKWGQETTDSQQKKEPCQISTKHTADSSQNQQEKDHNEISSFFEDSLQLKESSLNRSHEVDLVLKDSLCF